MGRFALPLALLKTTSQNQTLKRGVSGEKNTGAPSGIREKFGSPPPNLFKNFGRFAANTGAPLRTSRPAMGAPLPKIRTL